MHHCFYLKPLLPVRNVTYGAAHTDGFVVLVGCARIWRCHHACGCVCVCVCRCALVFLPVPQYSAQKAACSLAHGLVNTETTFVLWRNYLSKSHFTDAKYSHLKAPTDTRTLISYIYVHAHTYSHVSALHALAHPLSSDSMSALHSKWFQSRQWYWRQTPLRLYSLTLLLPHPPAQTYTQAHINMDLYSHQA